ncbi:TPA: hypothetical protein N0F65_008779 [Lagenidium giganteum]|uniref:Transposase zinc-ribbon domain-containing protein n=1 Tax=Lagenidium giganteum TaxID=4803 RepID=A0AAV2Z3L7_9STRA|nr:TPA: hypothetical protein N0F65_008779 [Lagenidium giganteum]
MHAGLLKNSVCCRKCGAMHLARKATTWRCSKRSCDTAQSVRAGTVFYHSRLPMSKLVMLIYYFAADEPASRVRQYVKVGWRAMTEWFNILRGFCSKEMLH